MAFTDDMVSALVPPADSCRSKAEELRRAYPKKSNRELADRAISTAQKWAAATGAASGVVGNPFAAGGLAVADLGYMLRAEAQLVGTIAAIFDIDSTRDPASFQADVLAMLFPGVVSEVLSNLGVQAGKTTTRTLIRKYISKDVLKMVIKFAAKYLGIKVTQKALIAKSLPVVGAAIGGTWNWIEIKRVGHSAIRYFESAE